MEELVKKRIEENKELFTKEELKTIYSNYILIKKIYKIAILDTLANPLY